MFVSLPELELRSVCCWCFNASKVANKKLLVCWCKESCVSFVLVVVTQQSFKFGFFNCVLSAFVMVT